MRRFVVVAVLAVILLSLAIGGAKLGAAAASSGGLVGDVDCEGDADDADLLVMLAFLGHVPRAIGDCPAVGQPRDGVAS